MSSRAKLTLNETLEDDRKEEPTPRQEIERNKEPKTEVKLTTGKDQGLLKKTLYLGLLIASVVVFKRKLF